MTTVTTLPRVVAAPAPQPAHAPLVQLRAAARGVVDQVDLTLHEREVVGVVGEAQCGKSTLARVTVGLLGLTSGERRFRDEDVTNIHGPAARAVQSCMQMVFHDPRAALNPHMRVLDIVGEAPVAHGLIRPRQKIEYVGLQLNRVGIDPMLMRRFPHQFTPGQCVRIGIARALAVQPRLLVCDEPLATLDVSVQAQLLNLLMDLRSALELAYLFVSRDVSVVTHVSDRVMVMHRGRIVESAPTAQLLAAPAHPYTRALLAARHGLEALERSSTSTQRDASSLPGVEPGCRFRAQCPHAMDRCRAQVPSRAEIAPGHLAACHLHSASAER